ncbi:TlpA family protein disulfide reductase [Tenacibaculum sp. MEBiC06402]|uniref:TlpA family protein disulfide reductase n=1 Tax=unclassified Tenacibaculum TaxID=2635139 RepID=UPI003B9D7394
MKKHLTLSNLIFVVAIFLLLYKPSRIWFIRQLSFSPSIEKVEESARVFDYNWRLKGLNTDDINFSEFKGKVVFLNFWATWCPPCVAELPSIQEFYNKYQDKVAFVFITNESTDEVMKFFKRTNYELPVYQTNGDYLNELPPITSIPRTFVLDKLGNIRVDTSGAADWNSSSFLASIDKMLDQE